MQFEDLRLSEPLLKAVHEAGYRRPTPIQSQAIPPVLEGRDVLGTAQTGTGKTAAFALPILQLLANAPAAELTPEPTETEAREKDDPKPTAGEQVGAEHSSRRGHHKGHGGRSRGQTAPKGKAPRGGKVRALIVCPTRELAQQIHESFETYGKHLDLRCAVAYGGVRQGPQVKALMAGADILVATPGRLLDLHEQGYAGFTGVKIFVVDEADRMMDMGFMPDLRRILAKLPHRRQTLFFSATMPAPIRRLADEILNDAVPIEVARVSSATPSVKHYVYFVSRSQKPALLAKLLRHAKHKRSLVFTSTKARADIVTRQLVDHGIRALALHGNKQQSEREHALEQFRAAHSPVLVATDIAARGLDIDDISCVYNYDLTSVPETYVHRIGRTGRAGATGTAISFCTAEEHGYLKAIEQLLHGPIQRLSSGVSAAPAPHRQGGEHKHGHGHASQGGSANPQAPAAGAPMRRVRGRLVRSGRPGMRVP